MGLNRDLVGKTYPKKEYQVELQAMQAFARATSEDNPRLLSPRATMASPMFGVVWLLPSVLDVFFDPELMQDANIGRMVHGGQDMQFLASVGPGDRVQTVAQIASIEDRSTGELLTIEANSHNQHQRPVLQARSTYFFRGPADAKRIAKKASPTRVPSVLFEHTVRVDEDQTMRYAAASGDHNPIHTDPEMAKAMGFPRIIVHGLCVMALAQKAVLDKLADSDPARLRRLGVQFSKVVYPGDELRCLGWELEPVANRMAVGFFVRSQRGEEVIRDGVAELLPF